MDCLVGFLRDECCQGFPPQALPLAVVVGVAAYRNGFAAIPRVGELVAMGIARGAAIAFLTAGAVTRVPAAMAVFVLVRRGVFVWYLMIALTGALASGVAWQLVAGP